MTNVPLEYIRQQQYDTESDDASNNDSVPPATSLNHGEKVVNPGYRV